MNNLKVTARKLRIMNLIIVGHHNNSEYQILNIQRNILAASKKPVKFMTVLRLPKKIFLK